jgi:REP element-mobilizing transposase RayT
MRHVQSADFAHLVWATWDRLPLLTGSVEQEAQRAIEAKCGELGAEVLAIGGSEDHVHLLVRLLVRLPATLAVADLMKHIKGASAHLVAQHSHPGQFFKWQGGYAAFFVSTSHRTRVTRYIAQQREHHAANTLIPTLELPSLPSPTASTADNEQPA